MAIKSYKGFDKEMKCRGFQFEEGKEYEVDGKISCCDNGFHACERPIDVFEYYPPGRSVYHEVEQDGDLSRFQDGDTKIASRKIKIGAAVSIFNMVKASIEYTKAHTTTENTDPKMATAGYKGAATAGYKGAATAGDKGAATAGDYGAATAGYKGAATAGDSGAATAGDKGAATSRGSSAVGENGIASARGNNVRIKGGLGSILVLAEESTDDYNVQHWKAFRIDGKRYKADTWYRLDDNGKVVKADD